MHSKLSHLALLVLGSALFGCATARPVTGEYSDPHTIEIVTDHFSESDLQQIADRMAASMAQSPTFQGASPQAPVRVVVAHLENHTNEPVDLESLADKIQVALFKTGKFEIFDQRARLAIAREYEYQQSNYVDPASAHAPGQQTPADFVLTGTLASIVQQGGSDERVYYKFSLSASDMKSGAVRWADEQELRKSLEITGISPQTSERLHIAGYATGGLLAAAGVAVFIAGASQAHDASFHLVASNCDPPFQDQTGCLKEVDDPATPANTQLEIIGGALVAGGITTAILTRVLVPDGNPRLASRNTDALFAPSLAQLGFGVNPSGGGNVVLGGSF